MAPDPYKGGVAPDTYEGGVAPDTQGVGVGLSTSRQGLPPATSGMDVVAGGVVQCAVEMRKQRNQMTQG